MICGCNPNKECDCGGNCSCGDPGCSNRPIITDMASLDVLIERLRESVYPDRNLDAEIMFELFAKPTGKHKIDGGPIGYIWPEDNPSWSFGIRFPGKGREWFDVVRKNNIETLVIERDGAFVLMNNLRIPKLTESVDAALTLLPKGFSWKIIHDIEFNQASVSYHEGPYWYDTESEAKTYVMAILIAILKARKVLQNNAQ